MLRGRFRLHILFARIHDNHIHRFLLFSSGRVGVLSRFVRIIRIFRFVRLLFATSRFILTSGIFRLFCAVVWLQRRLWSASSHNGDECRKKKYCCASHVHCIFVMYYSYDRSKGNRGVKVRISDDSLSFSGLFVASMKKLPIFAEVVGVPLVESGALFILMSP